MSFGKNRYRQASVLIEILLSMFIIAAVFPVAIALLKQTSDSILRLYDSRIAMQRIASAESLLDYPIYYCGYAMPIDAQNYQKSFNYQQVEPFDWEGPLSSVSYNNKNNALLKIAYGKQESVLVATGLNYNSSTRMLVINKKIPTDNIINSYSDFPAKVQNYILLASISSQPVPISVRQNFGTSILLGKTIYDNFTISMNDPLFLFCAMKIYAQNSILYSRDFRTSGVQPRVLGVQDMRFYPDLKHGCITVYTLVRGDIKINRSPTLQLTNFVKDSDNHQLINEWEKISSPYILYASKRTWRLPNCIKQINYMQNSAD